MKDERAALLGVLRFRWAFLSILQAELAGFPPEITEAATRKAAESGAEEFIKALLAVQELLRMDGRPMSREVAFQRCYAVGLLLDMDPKDPTMRMWSGEPVEAVFGL